MGKNILIFSDGTGQAGGLLPDEMRSNIYKLYRATRCGPDTTIDPALQLAFYDPGLGSQTDGGRLRLGLWRRLRNVLSQATGLGITDNIIDCYAEIVRMWEPGDRIYLFGFSRGAYTVRCVAGVLGLCGVPTRMKDGSPLRRDPDSARAIAKEAVKQVYRYGASIEGDPFQELRQERAKRFRADYGSDQDGRANEYPYFIGVFDTVAALGVAPPVRVALAASAACLLAGTAAGLAWWLSTWLTFVIAGVPALAAVIAYLATHLRYHPVKKKLYRAAWSMRFYDSRLSRRVGYARHALSIDESRANFAPVRWTNAGDARRRESSEPPRLRQVWFAGNHSDIGGSYEENGSRLSDIALQWMIEQAKEVPHPIHINESVLRLYPSATGPQHDECKKRFPGLWGALGFKWPVKHRSLLIAPLHPSVLERFAAPAVLQYDVMMPYRPEALREHVLVKQHYEAAADAATPPKRGSSVRSARRAVLAEAGNN